MCFFDANIGLFGVKNGLFKAIFVPSVAGVSYVSWYNTDYIERYFLLVISDFTLLVDRPTSTTLRVTYQPHKLVFGGLQS